MAGILASARYRLALRQILGKTCWAISSESLEFPNIFVTVPITAFWCRSMS